MIVSRMKAVARRRVRPLVGEARWERARRLLGRQPSRPSLTELAAKYGTDKWGRDHRYTPHYERHLGHLRDEEFVLLEIGVGGYSRVGAGGASLRMWQEYFPRARIVGLDIQDKSFVDGDRISTVRGSQTDKRVLRHIVETYGRPRVVVDDGSHNPAHIRATFTWLFRRLHPRGVYVIEDLQTSYWPEWGGSEDRQDRTSSMALVKDLLDGLNWEEFVEEPYAATYTDRHVRGLHAYHNLVLIEKGRNVEGSAKRRLLKKRYGT